MLALAVCVRQYLDVEVRIVNHRLTNDSAEELAGLTKEFETDIRLRGFLHLGRLCRLGITNVAATSEGLASVTRVEIESQILPDLQRPRNEKPRAQADA